VVSADPSTAQPIAVTVEKGKVKIQLEAYFNCSVNVALSTFAPALDPEEVFFVDSDGNMHRLSDEAYSAGHGSQGMGRKFTNLTFFKSNVLEVNKQFSAKLPPGLYLLTLGVTPYAPPCASSAPSDNENQSFYRWVVYFIVPVP
jgi:hypothetical protein